MLTISGSLQTDGNFSSFHKDRVKNITPAEAINATTAGRRPFKTPLIAPISPYFASSFANAIIIISEGVTKPADQGGLGFDYKWDMGWMNDTLDYFRTAPEYRSRDYHKLTFSMMYYYNDVFLLPLSHDEVVHGKATIAQKMHGEYEEKFPQARAFYMYMYAHPGKKLNFMGNEIGQLREWDEKREQDWDILKYPIHDAFHHFMQKLNHLYMTTPALSAKDYENAGFHWLDCHQEERCIYAFERTDGKERIAAVFNFSDEDQEGYELPITDAKELEVILASDDETFGGCKKYTKKKVKVTDGKAVLDLSAYSAVYYSIAV